MNVSPCYLDDGWFYHEKTSYDVQNFMTLKPLNTKKKNSETIYQGSLEKNRGVSRDLPHFGQVLSHFCCLEFPNCWLKKLQIHGQTSWLPRQSKGFYDNFGGYYDYFVDLVRNQGSAPSDPVELCCPYRRSFPQAGAVVRKHPKSIIGWWWIFFGSKLGFMFVCFFRPPRAPGQFCFPKSCWCFWL